jgi:hypothetical protein
LFVLCFFLILLLFGFVAEWAHLFVGNADATLRAVDDFCGHVDDRSGLDLGRLTGLMFMMRGNWVKRC